MRKNISIFNMIFVKILPTSLSLTFISFMTYLIFCLAFEIIIFIICQILANYNLTYYALLIDSYSLYINLFATILFVAPINLSIKNWYYSLNENHNVDITQAFIIFSSFKYYFKAIVFCTIKSLYIIINSIIILIPTTCVIAIFKFMTLTNGYSNSITMIVLFIATLLAIIGTLFCVINWVRLFFVDFLFLSSLKSKNSLFYYIKIINSNYYKFNFKTIVNSINNSNSAININETIEVPTSTLKGQTYYVKR